MTQPPAIERGPDRRKTFIGIGVTLVVMVVVFGVIFPSLVDWDQVGDALRAVDGSDIALLVGLGLLMYVPAGWLYSIAMPGMSLGRGTQAWVASTAVSTTLPGFDLVLRVSMYMSWGHPVETAMVGMFLSGLVEMTTKVALAVVATALWAAESADLTVLAVAAIAAVAVVAVGTVVALVLRSETAARRVGDRIQAALEWLFHHFRRTAPADVADRVLDARTQAREVLGGRWLVAFAAAFATQAVVFTILLVALRSAGVGEDVLPWWDVLFAHALVIILTSIPITPGSIGVAELAYTGILTAVAGNDVASQIAAGVLLFRLATWLLPIPIGWIAALVWKSRTGRSLFAAPDAAGADRAP